MALSFKGRVIDQSNCSKLSMEEKREFVYQLSNSPSATEMLQSWSRQEILQILCAEMGKERKYTGLTKLKMIEHLMKIVSEKKSGEEGITGLEKESSDGPSQRASKRQKKTDASLPLPVPVNSKATTNVENGLSNSIYCKNSACRAILREGDAFCKRCSCCICCKYDDNKDPSLWLVCNSDPPYHGVSCGMSCHLDCALKHEGSGIGKDAPYGTLDGSFRCVGCGKVNDLLASWRKQLIIAKATRRVDILCYRVSLSQKLLIGTKKYQHLQATVDEAVEKLEAEVGPLTGLAVNIGRGIVNRLSSGPEVQKLCASALESLDAMLSDTVVDLLAEAAKEGSVIASTTVRFEEVSTTSLAVVLDSQVPSADDIVGYKLWHRQAQDIHYPEDPTCTLYIIRPSTKFVVKGLSPATTYHFKVVPFSNSKQLGVVEAQVSTISSHDMVSNSLVIEREQSPVANCSSLSNPSSVEDETYQNTPPCRDQIVNRADSSSNDDVNCTRGNEGRLSDAIATLDENHVTQAVSSIPRSDLQKIEKMQSPECQFVKEMSTDGRSGGPVQSRMECVPFVRNPESTLPVTPCKIDTLKDVQGRNCRSNFYNKEAIDETGNGEEARNGSTLKKRSGEKREEECKEGGHTSGDLEYYVKLIRRLECEGHIEKDFRQKFLTWYSLRATPQEIRVVKAFVDTFIEDPASLAGQLVDAFSESISSRRSSSPVGAGFCMKLWH